LSIIREKPPRTEPFVVVEHLEHIIYLKYNPKYTLESRDGSLEKIHVCYNAVPSICLPIRLATATHPEPWDIKVLEDCIDLKEVHFS
jgi:hypothetical protein